MPWTLISNLRGPPGPPGQAPPVTFQSLVVTTLVRDPLTLSVLDGESQIMIEPVDIDRIP